MNAKIITYQGFNIVPKRDFGEKGFLIQNVWVKNGYVAIINGCNVMPGAIWFLSVDEAKRGIDCFKKADGDSNKFWELMKPLEPSHKKSLTEKETVILVIAREFYGKSWRTDIELAWYNGNYKCINEVYSNMSAALQSMRNDPNRQWNIQSVKL